MNHLTLFQEYVPNLTRDNDRQWRGNCPFHTERTPKNKSFCVNITNGLYHCKSCGAKGNAITIAKHFSENKYPDYNNSAINGYNKIELGRVDLYNQYLLDNLENIPPFWNPGIIRLLRIGWDSKKSNFVFPIFSKSGEIINVKHHHGPQYSGATAALYPHHLLNTYDNSYIIVAEGEKDVASLLSMGLQAVTSTGGSKVIPIDISDILKFNKIYLCLDNDSAGDAGIDLWIKKIKELNLKSYIRACDLSKFVDEGGDVTDYFLIEGKTQENFIEEIIDRSIWAKMPGTNVPIFIKQILLSDKMSTLSFRDQNVFFHLVHRAARYTFMTSKINGMRVRMRPGEFKTTYKEFAGLCGNKMTAKMVIRATDKLVLLELVHKENLKIKRGMKFIVRNWNENGHSESHSENKKVGIQNIVFLSPKELISKFNNGNSK